MVFRINKSDGHPTTHGQIFAPEITAGVAVGPVLWLPLARTRSRYPIVSHGPRVWHILGASWPRAKPFPRCSQPWLMKIIEIFCRTSSRVPDSHRACCSRARIAGACREFGSLPSDGPGIHFVLRRRSRRANLEDLARCARAYGRLRQQAGQQELAQILTRFAPGWSPPQQGQPTDTRTAPSVDPSEIAVRSRCPGC
jgi:hypothetical protein